MLGRKWLFWESLLCGELQNGQEVAVKLEEQSGVSAPETLAQDSDAAQLVVCSVSMCVRAAGLHQMLPYEAKLLKHLEGSEGIANVYFSGKEGARKLMTSDALG